MEDKFGKSDILKSDKYRDSCDILAVLLEESQQYSIEEIDNIIKEFGERIFNRRERVEK